MYNHVSERSGQKAPLIADDVYEIIMNVSFFCLPHLDFFFLFCLLVFDM